jgi:hypothetical protein
VSLSCWMSGTGMAISTRLQGARGCSHENLMAHVEQSKALYRKAKPIAFLFKPTKMSETTK